MADEGRINNVRKHANDPKLELTLGGLSKYRDGDILFTSWGRPDAQKGLPVTLEAFELMLKDESIPLEVRKHTKLLMGAGGGNDAFSGNNSEWKAIKEAMERIAQIEVKGKKGVFKNNVCYVNFLFPKRLANCADAGIFTSRFEPCGITPFECYAAGAPVISTNTGGAPDFVKPGVTGFLTKDPFMLNPEKVGLPAGTEGEALDAARRANISGQIAEKIKEYVTPGNWKEKQKEYIKNCICQKTEWHNNAEYNGGESALSIYLNKKCNVQNNNVISEYASDMRGEFNGSVFPKEIISFGTRMKNFCKSAAGKYSLAGAVLALLSSIVYINKHQNNAMSRILRFHKYERENI